MPKHKAFILWQPFGLLFIFMLLGSQTLKTEEIIKPTWGPYYHSQNFLPLTIQTKKKSRLKEIQCEDSKDIYPITAMVQSPYSAYIKVTSSFPKITLHFNNAESSSQNLRLHKLNANQVLIATNYPLDKPSNTDIQFSNWNTIPHRAYEFQMIDALFLHYQDDFQLDRRQRRALSQWVHQGGFLVIDNIDFLMKYKDLAVDFLGPYSQKKHPKINRKEAMLKALNPILASKKPIACNLGFFHINSNLKDSINPNLQNSAYRSLLKWKLRKRNNLLDEKDSLKIKHKKKSHNSSLQYTLFYFLILLVFLFSLYKFNLRYFLIILFFLTTGTAIYLSPLDQINGSQKRIILNSTQSIKSVVIEETHLMSTSPQNIEIQLSKDKIPYEMKSNHHITFLRDDSGEITHQTLYASDEEVILWKKKGINKFVQFKQNKNQHYIYRSKVPKKRIPINKLYRANEKEVVTLKWQKEEGSTLRKISTLNELGDYDQMLEQPWFLYCNELFYSPAIKASSAYIAEGHINQIELRTHPKLHQKELSYYIIEPNINAEN